MDASESSRSYAKRDIQEFSDMKSNRVVDDEDWEGIDKKKHRSSKSRKHSNAEEIEECDSSGRRKSSGDRTEVRKKSSGSSRGGSADEEEYEARNELRAKQMKKNYEEKSEKKSGSSYQDRDSDSGRKSRYTSGSKGYLAVDETERESSRKTSVKPSSHDGSQSKSRSKLDSSYENELEKMKDRDTSYSQRKESSRDKGTGSHELERNPRRRWDEPDAVRKVEDSGYIDRTDSRSGKTSENKHEVAREKYDSEHRVRSIDLNGDRGKSSNGEEKRVSGEGIKSRSRSEEDDNKQSSVARDDRSSGIKDDKRRRFSEKPSVLTEDIESSSYRSGTRDHGSRSEKPRKQSDIAHGGHDLVESRERPIYADEDGRARTRDGSGRESRHSKRSWSPERVGRRRHESDDSQSDNDRSARIKEREREKDGFRDEKSKSRDGNWSDRNRDHEGSKDSWKKRHYGGNDRETAYGDADHEKEWEPQRRDYERLESVSYPRTGYRRSGRGDSGAVNGATDSIEIRPTALDYGREESAATFAGRKAEVGSQPDFSSTMNNEEWNYAADDRIRADDIYGPADDPHERYPNDGSPMPECSGRSSIEPQSGKLRGQKGFVGSNRSTSGLSSIGGSQAPFGNNNQGSVALNRVPPQGAKGNRLGRVGRGRLAGRDGQRVGIPLPMMGPPPFVPLGLPPGAMQPLGPNMSPGPGPPIGLFIPPPFPGHNVWPGARGVDMNLIGVAPGLSPVPPGPSPPRFPPNVVSGPNPGMFINQQGPGRVSPGLPGPGFNAMGRGTSHDKSSGGWNNSRNTGPSGKAPSRGEQNDYSQNFVDTGMRPQNFIRELELTSVVEDYPKLRELIQKKDEIVAKAASPPMYYKCDLREFALTPEFFGTKFDVILVDPPWEEYVHRAPGVADHMEYWTFEEIRNLKIEAIADTPSFIFLWVGDGVGLEQGRDCFKKEHCLMGIKGTVRRSTDGHIIHANIDTDIIIAEEPPYGSTIKPEDMYRIIEHFSLGRRRLELFGEDHNIRSGWLTLGKGLSSSNFNMDAYIRNFADKDGKVWQGGGGRNPPPDAPHLVLTTPDIEGLRPKSPPQKNQHPQSSSLSQGIANASNRRPAGNSPQNAVINQEPPISLPSTPAQWAASPMLGLRGPDSNSVGQDEKMLDGYTYNNPSCGQATVVEHMEFEAHGAINL
ncbi:hypothetical protein Sjap_020920 [Stephania japonica]|uniref:Methyltransferase-like protein 1 n=1 Tax=Stephania japonica TaxID=461633 RepID=A0AAP0I0N9_9MAGN